MLVHAAVMRNMRYAAAFVVDAFMMSDKKS